MKKIVATMLLAGLCLTSLCGCAGKTKATEATETTGKADGSISVALSYDGEYEYVVYGSVEQLEVLKGCDYDVVAIQPLDVGGEPYEDYPWDTALIPKELAESFLVDEDSTHKTHQWVEDENGEEHIVRTCYQFKLTNCDNGGGFVRMPVLVLEIEEIDAEDIPIWGGA